jgi:hypothetical protein
MELIFKLRHWNIHLNHLQVFVYLFGSIRGAQMPQNSIKNVFLFVLDYFSYKNEPIDLVRGLFSSLDIGTYIPITCWSVCTFLGPFGGAQMPQNRIKRLFSGCFGPLLL